MTIFDEGVVDIGGLAFTPTETPTAWFQVGEQVVHPSRGAAEDFALIHYRRPAGDYGDPTSTDFNDFWGLHVWTGAVTEPPWADPVRPVGQDVFRIVFRIDLVDEANQLAYILHRGTRRTRDRPVPGVRQLRPRGVAAPGRRSGEPVCSSAPALRKAGTITIPPSRAGSCSLGSARH